MGILYQIKMAKKTSKNERPSERHSVLFIFSYLFLWVSGIIVYATESRKDSRLKFHSMQAILLGVIVFVMFMISFLQIISILLWIIGIVIGVLAYDGNDVDLPILGDFGRSVLGRQ